MNNNTVHERKDVRLHGTPPYTVVVLHGGPGAHGELAPVAEHLGTVAGVIEPIQSRMAIDGLVAELHEQLKPFATGPLTVIGHSWGAWLACLYAAQYPDSVAKLTLVSSGPFENRYAEGIMETRLSRLSDMGRMVVNSMLLELESSTPENASVLFTRLGVLLGRADSYDSDETFIEQGSVDYAQYRAVWEEAEKLRRTGGLLEALKAVQCPITAIHGDHDPHPVAGVKEPLEHIKPHAQFILLERCGHRPWVEKQARDDFFAVLENVVAGRT